MAAPPAAAHSAAAHSAAPVRTVIWWIRRDLRLADNPALAAALADAGRNGVLAPLFILDPALLNSEWVGAKRIAFLYAGLHALDAELRARGARLIVRSGPPAALLARVYGEVGAHAIYAERDHSPYATQRDRAIAASLPLYLVDGLTVVAPSALEKRTGGPYLLFTPYSKAWKDAVHAHSVNPLPAPERMAAPASLVSEELPGAPYPAGAPFVAGEGEAACRLAAFVQDAGGSIYDYANTRNRPDLEGTSQLSPYLRFGMISARSAAHAAFAAIARAPSAAAAHSADVWLNELIWRDFYVQILAAFPHVRRGAFRPQYNALAWSADEAAFAAWCAGRTGYPIVDAAMRQLAATGWMHNRLRMLVASFLVKDLLIDWRWGERFFMQTLIDGDPAANNGGWQWSAGVGTDAAPYFRIFNPTAQAIRFDPQGAFVRRWIPELAGLPAPAIHSPWTLRAADQARAHVRLGVDYPLPIVDHAFARERVLAAFAAVRAAG